MSLINIKKYLKEEIESLREQADSLEYASDTEVCGDCCYNTDSDEASFLHGQIDFAKKLLINIEAISQPYEEKEKKIRREYVGN